MHANTHKRKKKETCERSTIKKTKLEKNKTTLTVQATLSSEKGVLNNLDGCKKRWIFAGVCLHAILSPVLRRYVNSELEKLYKSLKSSHKIDFQDYVGHLKNYPSSSTTTHFLNYKAINKNKYECDSRLYDYNVKNHVDLSKTFLQTFMTNYTAFDDTCDASALLGIIDNIHIFPATVKRDANEIRQNVRNPWAHCDFTEWDDGKYKHSIQMIQNLIKQLSLCLTDENQIIAELDEWSNCVNYNLGTKLNLRLHGTCDLKAIFEMFPKLVDEKLKKNLKEIKEQMTELINALDVRLISLEKEVESIKSDLETYTLYTRNPTMQIAKTGDQAITENKIIDWKNQNKEFVPTEKSKNVYEKCKNNSCVIVIGVPGAGKTSIIHHSALQLQKDGYRIIPVKCPERIFELYQPGMKTVYVIDDLCGRYSANSSEVAKWENALSDISAVLADPFTKIIASCRFQVYNDDKLRDLDIFKSCSVNLAEDFSKEEKRHIARVYMTDNEVMEVERLMGDSNIKCDFFPLLCKMYHDNKRNGLSDIQRFFKNPFSFYEKHLDVLISKGDTDDKCKYCFLALLVIFNNALEEYFIDHKGIVHDNMLKDLSSSCGLTSVLRYDLKASINALEGTYIVKVGNIIRAIHDKMFDFLANYFGRKMLNCVIDHAKSAFISERLILKNLKDTSNEFAIILHDSYVQLYIKRMVSDWSQNKVFDVFGNTNMKDQFFRNEFLCHLKSLDKANQIKLANEVDTNGTETPLLQSCFLGDGKIVQWILDQNVDVNRGRANEAAPLFVACDVGNINVVTKLIAAGATIDSRRNDGVTPFLITCMKGHLEIVRYLVSKKTNVNQVTVDGECSLYIASYRGHKNLVQELIKVRGVDINHCTNIGASSLFAACNQCNREIVSTLLKEKTIDVNLSMKTGMSPLFISCVVGDKYIVHDLLNHGANVNKCVFGRRKITAFFDNYMDPVIYKNWWMKFVQDKGCFVPQSLDRYKKMLRNADDVFEIITEASPLFIACFLGHKDVVELLLNNNANVNKCKRDGSNPLKIAKQFENTDIVKLLIDKGAKDN